MKLYTLYMAAALCMLSSVGRAKPIDWYRGGHITFDVQKKHDAVVEKAIDLFDSDMQAVTGKNIRQAGNADVEIFQLNTASNKDLRTLESLKVPFMKFITKKNAFWLGVRDGKMIVAGADGCGTAYGLLELSRMAGVSPWIWWGDVRPSKRSRLTIDDKFEVTRAPSVELRGINIEQAGWNLSDYRHLFELMLRLRANVLSAGWDGGQSELPSNKDFKAMADSFSIKTATTHDGNAIRMHEHKRNTNVGITLHDDGYGYLMPTDNALENGGGLVYHLSFAGRPHDNLWLPTTQPGLVASELKTAYYHGANRLWLISINNPKLLAYPLSLAMDLAWNVNSVSNTQVSNHLKAWLAEQFGQPAAERLVNPMEDFYRLTAIRRPDMMDFTRQTVPTKANPTGDGGVTNTQFNAEEFGNELERYINDYLSVCQRVDDAEALVDDQLRDAYFAAVQYPVRAAALMAVKQLQAQEARLIGRPESFHHDDEALESAVRSVNAYRKLQQLNSYYTDSLADGKWKGKVDLAPRGLALYGQPLLPDAITEQEINRYGNGGPIDAPLQDDGCIIRQGYEYARGSKGAEEVGMLGRSMRAVSLQQDDSLVYEFETGTLGGVLRLAFVPLFSLDGGSSTCSVRLDNQPPTTIIVNDGSQTDRWASGVLRGQALVTLPVALKPGRHTLTVKALNDHVAIDQWMIDRYADRHFYVFPIGSTR